MAPNRKSPTLFTNSLESLKIPLKSEFLPLTHTREVAQREQQRSVKPQLVSAPQNELISDPKTEKQAASVSYWDWHPCDGTVEAEKEAAIDDLFSLSRLESNLVADSIRRETATEIVVDETNDQQQESYWNWSNNDVNAMSLDTECQDDQQVDNPHREECCDNYWDWDANEDLKDDMDHTSPAERLHQVVADSRKKFVRRHTHLPEPKGDHMSVSNHYWHWQEVQSN